MNRKITHAVFVTFLFTLILFAGISNRAPAFNYTYWRHDPATPGSWHETANWTNGVPTPGADAYINNSGTAQITTNAASYRLYLGYYAGAVEQTGGTNTTNHLYLGAASGPSGTYNLSAGELSAGYEYIGYEGAGEFNQSGGTNMIHHDLYVGIYPGSSGTYRLSGSAVLHVNGSMSIGAYSGNGRFEWFGGVLNTPAVILSARGTLAVGHDINIDDLVSGSLFGGTLSGLDLTELEITNGCTVTHNLDAVVVQSALIGTATGSGTYNLSGTGQLLAHGNEYIGFEGAGEFNQTGGTNTVNGYLYFGSSPSSVGTYNFFGGSLALGNLNINNGWLDIDISEIDAFTVSGDKVDLLDGYIADSKIFDSSSPSTLYAVYDSVNDWTTLEAIPEPFTAALAALGLIAVLIRRRSS